MKKKDKKGEQIQSVLMDFLGNDELTKSLNNYIYGDLEKNETEKKSQKKADQ